MNTTPLYLNLELVGAKSKTRQQKDFLTKHGIPKYEVVYDEEGNPATDEYGNEQWGALTDEYKAFQKGREGAVASSTRREQDVRAALQAEIDLLQKSNERNRRLVNKARLKTSETRDVARDDIGLLQNKLDTFAARGNRLQAFANISRKDVNLMEYTAKVQRKKKAEAAATKRRQRFYNLRAFNRGYEQNEIQRKIHELERIPHMTRAQRDEWMEKKRTRKIYSEIDIPDKLRGEQRRTWLRNKNQRQKLYLQGDSGYDTYVQRQRQLDQQMTVVNKYRY
jgi:hypothetical protein